MKPENKIFSLTSLVVLLVTLERFSPTTKILLQPDSFLRLHEVIQMSVLIVATVILPFCLLKIVSDNFKLLQKPVGFGLALLFLIGVYFYATGNGLHEVSSFSFNQFCDVHVVSGQPCSSMFFNDYYTGNILYFIGALLMNIPLLVFEERRAQSAWLPKDLGLLAVNAIIFALTIIAYAGFDRVLVGLVYAVIMTGIALYFFARHARDYKKYPVITYTALAYTLGTLLATVARFR